MSRDWFAMVLEWVVRVRWNPHDDQDPRFSCRTVRCNKFIIVIYFTCHSKPLGLGLIFAHYMFFGVLLWLEQYDETL